MEKIAALALFVVLAAPQAVDEAARLERAKALTRWEQTGAVDDLLAAATPEVKSMITGMGGAGVIAASFSAQLGAESKVLQESAVTLNGVTMYNRLSAFEKVPAAMTILTLDPTGAVSGFAVRPSIPPLPETGGPAVATPLALPLAKPARGDWFIAWGGRNAAVNYHVVAPDQRYAYDILLVRDGRSYVGDAQKNESYFCFGEPVLSPAAGKVVRVVDGIVDNVPVGAMNASQPPGNHVIIEHRPGEFSLMGHLKKGSAAVTQGQTVAAGTKIGLCGNSGNSSEPHLHYHLQTTGEYGRGAQGLPAVFQNITVDGRRVASYVPVRGQRIAP